MRWFPIDRTGEPAVWTTSRQKRATDMGLVFRRRPDRCPERSTSDPTGQTCVRHFSPVARGVPVAERGSLDLGREGSTPFPFSSSAWLDSSGGTPAARIAWSPSRARFPRHGGKKRKSFAWEEEGGPGPTNYEAGCDRRTLALSALPLHKGASTRCLSFTSCMKAPGR